MSKKPRYARSAFASIEAAKQFSEEHGLTSWEEVTAQWNKQNNASLTRGLVMKIARVAHEKLRRGLRGIEF